MDGEYMRESTLVLACMYILLVRLLALIVLLVRLLALIRKARIVKLTLIL